MLDDPPFKDNERGNPTPRVPTIIEDIIEEEEVDGNDNMERQVSKQDNHPLIDQSQPIDSIL